MKIKFLTPVFLLVFSISYAQTPTWTKDERNGLYDNCLSYLLKYKNTTQDQKESMALCYLDEITKKYAKSDFEAKLDIEVKRIKEGIITGCAKNLGIDLKNEPIKTEPVKEEIAVEKKAPEQPKADNPTSDILIGRWKTDKGSTVSFKDGGKYSEINLKGQELNGDWFLDGIVLTISIQEVKSQLITGNDIIKYKSSKYDFEKFSKDFIKYTREGIVETIQANRIK